MRTQKVPVSPRETPSCKVGSQGCCRHFLVAL